MLEYRVAILVQTDIVLLEYFKETLGLLLELFGAFTNFCDDFFVGEGFETIVDVATVLVGPHESLSAIEESFLDLHEGLLLDILTVQFFD